MNNGKIATIIFYVLLFLSASMLVISFYLPPKGVVDPSAISATAEVMGFASIGYGLELVRIGKFHKFSVKRRDTEIVAENEKVIQKDYKANR